jgi:nitrogen regulatory protein PII
MKKIEAVIAPSNLDAVRKELERRGIRCGLTVVDVQHSDSEKRFLGAEHASSETLQDRIKLELIVEDSDSEKAVNIILRHAQPEPDEQGGQIAVLEVSDILRIGRE